MIAAIDAPNATQIMTLNIIPINIQTRYALKKLDLLFLPPPNANTNIIMIFTQGIIIRSSATIHSPKDTGSSRLSF